MLGIFQCKCYLIGIRSCVSLCLNVSIQGLLWGVVYLSQSHISYFSLAGAQQREEDKGQTDGKRGRQSEMEMRLWSDRSFASEMEEAAISVSSSEGETLFSLYLWLPVFLLTSVCLPFNLPHCLSFLSSL